MATANKSQTTVIHEYQADELGAPFKVVLIDSVKQLIDLETGEVEKVIIPNVRGLVRCIAITRILSPRKLSGIEIKFVRKAFKLAANAVAEMIGVTPEHLSRCESGERVLSVGAEKCFRASIFLEQFKNLDKMDELCEGNEDLMVKLEKLRRAIKGIGDIIGKMQINSAFDTNDYLVFKFRAISNNERDLFEDDENANWHSDDNSLALAA